SFADCFDERTGRRVVVIDFSIAEIADPKLIFHDGQSPRRVQIAMRNQTAEQITVGIKYIDKTVTRSGHVIAFIAALFRVGDENFSLEISDAEGRKSLRNTWIGEAHVRRVEIFIKDVDAAAFE